MEREDPRCETASPGDSGYTKGVLNNDSAVKPTCLCVLKELLVFSSDCLLFRVFTDLF
jgi:hypothetical protein